MPPVMTLPIDHSQSLLAGSRTREKESFIGRQCLSSNNNGAIPLNHVVSLIEHPNAKLVGQINYKETGLNYWLGDSREFACDFFFLSQETLTEDSTKWDDMK